MKHLLLATIGCLCYMIPLLAQSESAVEAIRNADAEALSKCFNANVELTLLGSGNLYSKAQSTKILSDFFSSNPVTEFTVVHQGNKQESGFVAGKLLSKSKEYRVFYTYKLSGQQNLIHQIRIENIE